MTVQTPPLPKPTTVGVQVAHAEARLPTLEATGVAPHRTFFSKIVERCGRARLQADVVF
ncbi:MAG: hypothetical protein HND46_23100 [Chloroflexi bacterium]|nr:hypothetical protein [Chloroflexota bacterium]